MLHFLTVVGARPQIIKAAALSRAIRNHFSTQIRETILHTGQHYDDNMSQVFFDELGVPAPDYNLGVGSASHGEQTAAMISGIEKILLKEKAKVIVLYGDTNSTLAGAVAASKLHVPVVHIEAGLRSFNKKMPEEINRIVCDHVSEMLFTPTKAGLDNLSKEGLNAGSSIVFHCGDIMYDNSLYFADLAEKKSTLLQNEKLHAGEYFLATVHRDSNTDHPERLASIFAAFEEIAKVHAMPVVVPLHPRTKKKLGEQKISTGKNVRILPPASFLDMIALEKNARLLLTDSGGVQKEAFFFRKPCVILREETEWVELVECGSALLAGFTQNKITEAADALLKKECSFPPVFGDGHAAEFICREMIRHFSGS